MARTVSETDLRKAVVDAINQVFAEKDECLAILRENIEAILGAEETDELARIEARLDQLQHELLRLATSGAEYDLVAEEIHKFQFEKEEVLSRQVESLGAKQRIEDLMVFLEEQSGEVEEYDETLVRRLIGKITVLDEGLVVKFKSGLEVEVVGNYKLWLNIQIEYKGGFNIMFVKYCKIIKVLCHKCKTFGRSCPNAFKKRFVFPYQCKIRCC